MVKKIKNVTILGSTGTIGVNTLDVIRRHPERFRAFALTANTKHEKLFEQCLEFKPQFAVMRDDQGAELLRDAIGNTPLQTQVLCGESALETVASHSEVDSVMAAIVGAAGLKSSFAAAQSGKQLLLANKEALVMSGRLFMEAVHQSSAKLLPIDSEHNAIFQCLPNDYAGNLKSVGVTKILLTASGGPFRLHTYQELTEVTLKQALNHPNWVMGQKITIDSATLMNKGLEVIEAHWLFGATRDQIEVVVHPQSVVHSLVQYNDGSVLAELGNPDMRTPIAHALAWPDRISSGVSSLDLFQISRLDFERPDVKRFPCLRLAFEAMAAGGSAMAVLNAANEIAVAAFLDQRIRFTAIPELIESVLSQVNVFQIEKLSDVFKADHEARYFATEWLSKSNRLC